jgi:ribosomal protein L7/L12
VRATRHLGLSRGCDKFDSRSVAASGKQHAGGGSGGDVFDVRVVAFAGGSAATLQALQDLFGLDREGAQRLVDNVPLIVRRAAPANEAQSFVTALRGIGAQVALERPSNENGFPTSAGQPVPLPKPAARPGKAAPPPPKAAVQKPPRPAPREGSPLPRPIIRQATADLEFDMGGLDSPAGGEEPNSSMQPLGAPNLGTRRNEIDFGGAPESSMLELDVASVRGAGSDGANATRAAVSQPSAVGRTTLTGRVASMPAAAASVQSAKPHEEPASGRMSRTDVSAVAGPGPMSRAAVVHQTGNESAAKSAARVRQVALLRILAGVGIAALGISFDSSIIWGNANSISLLAHAIAIYQLGVGLRELAP